MSGKFGIKTDKFGIDLFIGQENSRENIDLGTLAGSSKRENFIGMEYVLIDA